MPREFSRASRLAAQVQRELAELFLRGVGDPRLHAATVSRVKVTKDLTRAIVYLQASAPELAEETLRAARKARAYLRRELAHRIRARALPQLEFDWDSEFESANRVLALIDSVVVKRTSERPEDHAAVRSDETYQDK